MRNNETIQYYIQYWQLIYALEVNNKQEVVKQDSKPQHKSLLGHFIELLVAPFSRSILRRKNENNRTKIWHRW